jgi:uncharacterized membrane protein YeiH
MLPEVCDGHTSGRGVCDQLRSVTVLTVAGVIIAEILQLLGILAFAISGALIGVRRRLDLLGVLVVGGATGTGGGILRDMLIGVHPPVTFVYWPNIAVAIGGALIVFFFHPSISRIHVFEVVFDAFGLGLFAATGTVTAMQSGLAPLTSVLLGTITAIGGGVIRDVLVNTIPAVLTRELYAVSALVGAAVAALVLLVFDAPSVASFVGVAVAIVLRLLSYWRGWNLPMPRLVADDRGERA